MLAQPAMEPLNCELNPPAAEVSGVRSWAWAGEIAERNVDTKKMIRVRI